MPPLQTQFPATILSSVISPPAAPSGLAITSAINQSIVPQVNPTLTWGAAPGATKYDVRAATNSTISSFATLTGASDLASPTYTVGASDLNYFRRYWLQVRAGNDAGWSDWSAPLAILTPLPAAITAWGFAGAGSDLLNGGTYESSDTSDVAEIGDPVYHIDSILGGYSHIQSDQPTRPVLRADSSGRPYLDFSGTQWAAAIRDDVVVDDTPYHFGAVFATEQTSHATFINIDHLSTNLTRLQLEWNQGGADGRIAYTHRAAGAANSKFVQNTGANDGNPHLFQVQRDTSTSWNCWLDNVVSGSVDNDAVGATGATRFTLGAAFNGAVGPNNHCVGGLYLWYAASTAIKGISYNGETLYQMLKRFYGVV